jgi:succinate dehydrogenase hydrophobic anchor subunit
MSVWRFMKISGLIILFIIQLNIYIFLKSRLGNRSFTAWILKDPFIVGIGLALIYVLILLPIKGINYLLRRVTTEKYAVVPN